VCVLQNQKSLSELVTRIQNLHNVHHHLNINCENHRSLLKGHHATPFMHLSGSGFRYEKTVPFGLSWQFPTTSMETADFADGVGGPLQELPAKAGKFLKWPFMLKANLWFRLQHARPALCSS
jgi:hypothetical protein